MHLLHAQTPLEDDRKLSEYSIPEGGIISALFEPDVDINIEVRSRHQAQNLTISNTTSVMTLKVQICGVIRCSMVPERLEFRFGNITLENPVPLHFYGIKDGSRLYLVKPYIQVMVENNNGDLICWRLDRKDTIKEVKVELTTSFNNVSTKQLHLYVVRDGQTFDELDDDEETVGNCKIKDDDNLYLLTYKWTSGKTVTVTQKGRKLQGFENDDTCLGIKVKVQDQLGLPVATLKVFRADHVKEVLRHEVKSYFHQGKPRLCLNDDEKPFIRRDQYQLAVVTEEELQAEAPQKEQEWKAEQERKKQEEEKKAKQGREVCSIFLRDYKIGTGIYN